MSLKEVALDGVDYVTCKKHHDLKDMEGKPLRASKGQKIQAVRAHVDKYPMFGIRTNTGTFLIPASQYNNNFDKFKESL